MTDTHSDGTDLTDLTVVVAGATSAAGVATTLALTTAGARVIAVGSDKDRLAKALAHVDRVDLRVCDLADYSAVLDLAAMLREEGAGVDGLIHLVGGWRGGEGIAGQSDDDYETLHRLVLTTLRNTTRAFVADLEESSRGRLAIVSATAVDRPTAGNASYAAVKAAAETWVKATAQQFTSHADAQRPLAAATILVVKALLDDAMQAARPDRSFPGYTHVSDLAAALTQLFAQDPAEINGRRIDLST